MRCGCRRQTSPDEAHQRTAGHRRNTGKLLTAEKVADRLDVGENWVWARARAGRIPHIKLGRYTRFRVEAIDAWIAQLEEGGAEGHTDIKTTQIYADYAPVANEAAIVEAAFTPPEPTVQVEKK